VVAGHSYGGSVMSEAADGAPGVKALVYVASFHLEAGESTAELAAKYPGGELAARATAAVELVAA
jgi:pimeloyl-ACP methyl ester carboxylesterase